MANINDLVYEATHDEKKSGNPSIHSKISKSFKGDATPDSDNPNWSAPIQDPVQPADWEGGVDQLGEPEHMKEDLSNLASGEAASIRLQMAIKKHHSANK